MYESTPQCYTMLSLSTFYGLRILEDFAQAIKIRAWDRPTLATPLLCLPCALVCTNYGGFKRKLKYDQ